ncbi:hypothetical protein D3C71_1532540 [compost metagenome]
MRAAEQTDVPRPARVGHGLQHAPRGRVRATHARMRIAVTCARRRHIHSEHQRGHTGRLGPLQRIAHEAAVLEHIQLEPHRPVDRRRHFLDRADRDGGQRERNPAARRRPRRLHFTAARVHAGQPDRGQRHRHRQAFAEQLRFQAQIGHVAQDALAQCDVRQIRDIAFQGVLGIRAAIDVVEQERRQAALRRCAVIGGGGNDHGSTVGRRKP